MSYNFTLWNDDSDTIIYLKENSAYEAVIGHHKIKNLRGHVLLLMHTKGYKHTIMQKRV